MASNAKSQAAGRPRVIGLLGGGIIGGGFAARFVLDGADIKLYDPAPNAEESLQKMLAAGRRAYRALTYVPLPPEGKYTISLMPR